MTKNEKIAKITSQLINNIAKHEGSEEWNACQLYVNTWVLTCGLYPIYKKARGEDVRDYDGRVQTYKKLFDDFLEYFTCARINPKIKPYATIILFNIVNRDLVLALFECIYTKEERNKKARSLNYIPYEEISDKKTKYYLLTSAL